MRFIYTVASILLFAIILPSCASEEKSPEKEELEMLYAKRDSINKEIKKLEHLLVESGESTNPYLLVATEALKASNFNHFIKVQGRIESESTVEVGATASGTVIAINVKAGDRVQKGAILIKLDDRIILKSLAEVQSQLDFATTLFEKQKSLWDQQIGSEVQFLTAKNNKESLERRLASLNEQLQLTRLKAPESGTVDEVMVRQGQLIAPGMTCARVVNMSDLKIVADVSEAYTGVVQNGAKVKIRIPDIDAAFDATIKNVSYNIHPVNRTFRVEIDLKEKNPAFRPNMIAILQINDYQNNNAVLVPQNIIQSSNGQNFVFVAEPGEPMLAKKQMIETGVSYEGQVEVKKGLKTGDQLIVKGFQELNDGVAIRVN